VIHTKDGWIIQRGDRKWGPSTFLSSHDDPQFDEIAKALGVEGEDKTKLARAIFDTKVTVSKIERDVDEGGDLTFEGEGIKIQILNEDGVRVPASQLFYRFGDEMIVGEITYSHARVEKTVKGRGGKEEVVEYETIVPVLVWGHYFGGEILERDLKPYQLAKKLEVQDHPIMVELKARYSGTLETLMSLEVAQKFLRGESALSWEILFLKIKEALEKFVSFNWDSRLYDVVACWVLGTYFVEFFSTYPFLYAYGSQGAGKSRLITTTIYLSRHGFLVTDPSDASLYRVAEAFRPAMGIDESLLGKGAWKLIRTAFKKGLKVPRVEKTSKEEFILALFETYMLVAFASTERPSELGGSEADEARALFVFMQKAPDPIGRDPEAWDFTELRNQLYLLRLTRAPEVLAALRETETLDLKLYGHDREVWLPLFTIARLVGEDVYQNLKVYAEELGAIKKQFQYWEEKILLAAIAQLYEGITYYYWSVSWAFEVPYSPKEVLQRYRHYVEPWLGENSYKYYLDLPGCEANYVAKLEGRMRDLKKEIEVLREKGGSKQQINDLVDRWWSCRALRFFHVSHYFSEDTFHNLVGIFSAWAIPKAQKIFACLSSLVDPRLYREMLGLYRRDPLEGGEETEAKA